MKLLIVSWYMPPFNTIGALRVGKLCKYLHQHGHDVRVLSCRDLPFDRTLALEFPEERILRTASMDVNGLPKLVQRLRLALRARGRAAPADIGPGGAPSAAPAAAGQPRGLIARILRALRVVYTGTLNFPDARIGWLPAGVRGGKRILSAWRPDVVVASGPPFTGLLIGRALSRYARIPLVLEYRDRFWEDPLVPPTALRKRMERRLENWWAADASAIVTVSEPWSEAYRARFGLPVATVYNGFDPDDYPADYPRRATDPEQLRIVYTGVFYADRRDPSPLFEAIRQLGDEAQFVRVAFYGADREMVARLAVRHGVSDQVETHDRIPYRESIDQQMNGDVLLLLQWNDPSERGDWPAKLFEYLAARRPVLGLGPLDGLAAETVRARGAGEFANDPEAIAAILRRWIAVKRHDGAIPLLPPSVREGLSRDEQFRTLEGFLQELLCNLAGVAGAEKKA